MYTFSTILLHNLGILLYLTCTATFIEYKYIQRVIQVLSFISLGRKRNSFSAASDTTHINAFSFINLVQHVSINIAAISGAHFYIWLCPHHTLSTYVIVITTCNLVHTRVLYLKYIALVHHNLIEVI